MDPQQQVQPQIQSPLVPAQQPSAVPVTCSSCHFPLSPDFLFCPHCGKNVKEPPLSTSVGRQAWIYLVSFFFPPFGLWPAIKYIRQKDQKMRIIGWVAVVLTVLSIFLTVRFTMELLDQVNSSLSQQMKLYQGVGL